VSLPDSVFARESSRRAPGRNHADTLVISDLHLGSRSRVDVLRRPEIAEVLARELREREVRRLVLLGDTLELRHGPLREALAAAEPALATIGAAVDQLVLVPGNHDHALLGPWLARRRRDGAPAPLGLEENVDWEPGEPLATIAAAAQPAALAVAYPGLWLRDGVYAMHGHYLDVHITVPTFERLGVGVMGRLTGPMPERATPDDYERHLEPLYAWLAAVAENAPPGRRSRGAGGSVRVWRALSGSSGHAAPQLLAMRAAATVALRLANRAGLGPLQTDVAKLDLRKAGLAALAEVSHRLGIEAEHVLFGHIHRSGPWPGDDPDEWRARDGAQLWNSGCWVFERHFLTRRPGESPYWPGTALELDEDGPPRLVRLLGYRGASELAP
jgi:Calcineurin-like phosphoesterase